MADSIVSGGLEFPAAWLRCSAAATYKPDEALIRVRAAATELEDQDLAFLVDSDLVNPSDLPSGREVAGTVKVMFVGEENGTATVQVLGEPISYGPRIVVPSDELVGR